MSRNKVRLPAKTTVLFRTVSRLADERGVAAYAVGGFVRDLLLSRPTVDVDIAVLGDGLAFAEALARVTGGTTEAFTRFGTSIVIVPGFGKVDVATARSETYEKPGALPTVVPGSIDEDLSRRDFTINSMALDLRKGRFLDLIDPLGGRKDLAKRLIRAHHPGSFVDDPTRIFRAVRFEQRFSKRLEKRTEAWLHAALKKGCLDTVSGERIRHELILIFREPHPDKAVRRLNEIGVLKEVHERLGLRDGDALILHRVPASLKLFARLDKQVEDPWMVWFQALLGGLSEKDGQVLSERLLLSRNERKVVAQRVTFGRRARARLSSGRLSFSHIHEILAPLVNEVQCFVMASLSPRHRRRVEGYYRRSASLRPFLRGRDLQDLGIPPGFKYSYILQKAYAMQLDGEFSSKRDALKWAKKLHV